MGKNMSEAGNDKKKIKTTAKASETAKDMEKTKAGNSKWEEADTANPDKVKTIKSGKGKTDIGKSTAGVGKKTGGAGKTTSGAGKKVTGAGKTTAGAGKKTSGNSTSSERKPAGKAKTKAKNPNLRLVKNGDIEVKNTKEKPAAAKESIKEKEYKNVYQDRLEPGEWFVQHKSLVLIVLTIIAAVGILAAAYFYVIKTYTVTTVYVDGNVHYTNEEVMEMVMTGRYGSNSLYLAAKYKDKGVEGVPFVEKMDVNILAPDTIRINVYEKALAGYVEYLGRYMYFDKDGIVVESSEIRTSGIPQVTGLKFDYVVLNEPLPVENDDIFTGILSITQLLTKYELTADKIFFDSSYDLTLYFGGVRVTLGSGSTIDEKIMRLQYILPELEGKTGTLQMENYTDNTKNITFNQE